MSKRWEQATIFFIIMERIDVNGIVLIVINSRYHIKCRARGAGKTIGYGFDFGYLGLVGLVVFVLGTIIIGFKVLNKYRERREKNNKKYLGREVLLTGALAAFCAQALIGMFVFNRSINGMALLTFMFIGSIILANVVTLKSRS